MVIIEICRKFYQKDDDNQITKMCEKSFDGEISEQANYVYGGKKYGMIHIGEHIMIYIN